MQQQTISTKKTVLWSGAFYILSDIIAFALGVGYLLIVIGINSVIRLAIVHYQPVRNIVIRWLGRDKNFVSPAPAITWWRAITIALNLIIRIFMIGLGIWILLHNTFLQQNFLYRAFAR